MEVRWPKVSTVFLGGGSVVATWRFWGWVWVCCCCCCCCSVEKPRRKLAAMVLSSDSYILSCSVSVWGWVDERWLTVVTEVSLENWASGAVAVEPPPRKSSSLGPPVNIDKSVASFSEAAASTTLPVKVNPKINFLWWYYLILSLRIIQ